MKHAFLILAHSKQNIIINLIESILQDKNNTIFIHVDKKSQSLYTYLEQTFATNNRVILLKNRYRVYWGHFNMVLATLELLKTSKLKQQFDYYSLLSGQCLPIKNIHEFNNFLKQNNSYNYLEYFKIEDEAWFDRIQYHHIPMYFRKSNMIFFKIIEIINSKACGLCLKLQKKLKLKRQINKNNIFAGSQWFTINDLLVTHLLTQIRNNPNTLIPYKHTSCSDEIFFQTLIMNSSHKDSVINNNLRYITWNHKSEPNTIKVEDYLTLITTKDKFFARKFDDNIDSSIINKLMSDIKETH